mgnify:CR=1 FL=1
MSSPPPISVLLPVRNGAEYLPEAIASIEAQTYSKYEVVAVDDGSSDDSWFVLQEWAGRDERVKVFRRGRPGLYQHLSLHVVKLLGLIWQGWMQMTLLAPPALNYRFS